MSGVRAAKGLGAPRRRPSQRAGADEPSHGSPGNRGAAELQSLRLLRRGVGERLSGKE